MKDEMHIETRAPAATEDEGNTRQVYRIEADGSERPIPMLELRKGDRFKIRTEHPEDHLYGQGDTVFEALSDGHMHGGVPTVEIAKNLLTGVEPGLYWWHRTTDETGMSGTGRVAQVAVFEDGAAVIRWLAHRNSVGVSSFAVYESIDNLLNVHGHGDRKVGHLEPVSP